MTPTPGELRDGRQPTSVDIGGTPGDIAVAADGRMALATNLSTNQVAIIDTKVIQTVPVNNPGRIALSANGLTAYVTSTLLNELSIVDLSTGIDPMVIKVPLCAACDSQSDIAVSADGTRAFVSHPGADTVSVITYAGAGTTPVVSSVAVNLPYSIAASADGSVAVVYGGDGRVSVIDASETQPKAVAVPDYFNSFRSTGFIAVSADGRRAWVTNHNGYGSVVAVDISNPSDPTVLWRQSLFDLPHSIATTADGTRAYVVAHDHFWILDTRSGTWAAKPANMPPGITDNNGSDFQQVAVSGRGDVVVATSISGDLVVLNASAF